MQRQPFLCCPSLHPKLDYDGTLSQDLWDMREDWICGEDDDMSRGRITAAGERTEGRGKASKGRGGVACDNSGSILKGVDGGFQSHKSTRSLSHSDSNEECVNTNPVNQFLQQKKTKKTRPFISCAQSFSEGLCSFLHSLPLPLSLFKELSFQTHIGSCARYSSFCFFIHQSPVRRRRRRAVCVSNARC